MTDKKRTPSPATIAKNAAGRVFKLKQDRDKAIAAYDSAATKFNVKITKINEDIVAAEKTLADLGMRVESIGGGGE